jgi:hypothetical protein
MRVPIESRVLMAVAAALVPPAERADWRREWDAEIWWWLGSHTGERLRLAIHCAGALKDAAYLRASHGDAIITLRRMAGSPGTCLACLALLLAAVAATSGLRETRRVLHGDPFGGAHLAVLSQTLPFMGAYLGVPPAKVADWNSRAQSLEGAAIYSRTRRREVARADPNFFALLGTQPAIGSLSVSAMPAAVLSYQCWQRKFHGDPAIVGRTVDSARVIGVLPRDFWFLDMRPDIWILGPAASDAPASALARLKPGVTPGDAQAELRKLAAQVKPVSRGSAVVVEPVERLSARPLSALGLPWLALVCGAVATAIMRFRHAPKFAAFLAAKVVLSLTLMLLATVEFGSSWMTINSGETNLAAGVASLWLFLAGPGAALYWCWRDQRQRCRTCLHRLEMPVHFGEGARMLLEHAGTELVCPQGHGSLFTMDGADPAAQWYQLFAGR